ncbi:MAG: translation initiation factor IF-2 N-terminal domain-containing protein, partial [Desulfuromonadales bacterium]|nr:translation initiation factor IF-2 N-terminal domain-containing protein [Desulfuromonadales bacterium]
MGKIRVHELAQKMGLENKELISRLKAIGVDVKSHMSAVDEEVIKKLQAPPTVTMTVKDIAQEETRVTSTLIRRRAKVVEKTVEVPVDEAPEPEKTEVKEAEVTEQEKAETKKEKKKVEVDSEKNKTEIKEPQKATANKAVILGRVELPERKQNEQQQTTKREVIPSKERPFS